MAQDLAHLTMRVSPYGHVNYKTRRAIAWLLYHTPFSSRVLALLQKLVTHLANIDCAHRQTIEFTAKLHEKGAPQRFASGFGYESPFRELEIADHYRQQLANGDIDRQPTESGAIYHYIIPTLSELIQRNGIKNVVDFGVSYGHTDNELAKACPDTQFWGVDRAAMTKFYNEQYFQLSNLHFMASDIFEVLKSRAWGGSLIFHMRILTCLPPAFVEEFYRAAATAGFTRIVGVEQCGISWQTGKPYVFSLEDQESVVFRNYMYIHNYPRLLAKAGYGLKDSRLLETRHPDPNFRLIAFVAEKDH